MNFKTEISLVGSGYICGPLSHPCVLTHVLNCVLLAFCAVIT